MCDSKSRYKFLHFVRKTRPQAYQNSREPKSATTFSIKHDVSETASLAGRSLFTEKSVPCRDQRPLQGRPLEGPSTVFEIILKNTTKCAVGLRIKILAWKHDSFLI